MNKGRVLLWRAREGQTIPATNNASNLKLREGKHSKRADVRSTERFHCSPSLLTCGESLLPDPHREAAAAPQGPAAGL